MAGIGFELKKLFVNREKPSLFGNLKAVVFSAIVSVGPWIITASSLNILIFLSNRVELSRAKQTIFMSSIFYAFVFSQILTCLFQYLITRYVSDCVFQKKFYKIRGAYLGSTKLVAIFSFFISFLFIKNGNLSIGYKASFIFLFVFMCLSWIGMIFISLLKKYRFLIASFFLGNIASTLLGYYFLTYPVSFFKEEPIFWMLFSYGIGIFLNFIMTSSYILRAFQGSGENNFEFLTYLKGYFSLVLIGFLYSIGVWGHVFMNWIVGDSYTIVNTFRVSPLYEVAIFYCYCISIPSIIYFCIFLETKFLPVYKEYYKNICETGTYDEIQEALQKMTKTLYQEILYGMEWQFLISLSFALIANAIFTYFDMDIYLLDLFRIGIFSTYCATFVSIMVTIFLYFDLRIQAMGISSFLLFSNLLFTYVFSKLGKQYTGIGFFLASFLTFALSIFFFPRVFEELNYNTMFWQNFKYQIGNKFLRKFAKLMEKKFYILLTLSCLLLFGSCISYYDANGFHRKTGHNWHSMGVYDKDGFDMDGYTQVGMDKKGFNKKHWNMLTKSYYDYAGFDYEGIHKDTKKTYDERGFDINQHNVFTNTAYDTNGFDYEGIHKDTKRKYDKNGWNYYGLHEKTQTYYNEEGWNVEGINKRGFNREAWNVETKSPYDYAGFDYAGVHKNTKKIYDERGFDVNQHNVFTNTSYDKNGFNYEGIHKDTKREYDENGWNYYGLHEQTKTYYNKAGYTREGLDKDGYEKGKRPANLEDEWMDKQGFNKKGIYIRGY
ncbi:exopolysaccharide Pel transporter PelG [Fusobacterium necrophorum]|uniref:Membrane protein n=1 Tax=Fusobacterium necrophorum DJ-2 TaxID=1441737 RepID=A0AB73C6Q8_9FUSO|nr:exopolysaccharide Pel transporter PelG [Fusobacterium necrophorum]KDE64531.1 membrane protein [Fusobacterium necrophorum DJ-1]KDE73792.1 membrane protein [Fusobacterium necrophorum DJ-2]MBR8821827.1 hypothetical protein [Fusobacterium necrophorum]MCF0161883.1 exopolysaccharide Pel transporter PelG [Fusobacterium necrophorum]